MLRQLLVVLFLFFLHVSAAPAEPRHGGAQIPINPQAEDQASIIAALKKSQVIPDVLPAFLPKVAINLTYLPDEVDVALGNSIPVPATAKPPALTIIPLHDTDADFLPSPTRRLGKTLTLVLTDPDATSRADPVKGQMCHWILSGIRLRELNASERFHVTDPAAYTLETNGLSLNSEQVVQHEAIGELVEYMQPAPPPKTGKHRYIFVLLEFENESEDGTLKKPADRPHWGYKHVGQGVMDWAKDNGLVPIGANFFYAQDEKQ